ncbi:hypothetical protein V6N11_018833 [Hibiscus sabdariffa]|uniref:Uncharacterized protein n=2 Tax=Hibiscus sabdariffa TaxID=183260 RepID=A0ABR2N8Q3_9ROSI
MTRFGLKLGPVGFGVSTLHDSDESSGGGARQSGSYSGNNSNDDPHNSGGGDSVPNNNKMTQTHPKSHLTLTIGARQRRNGGARKIEGKAEGILHDPSQKAAWFGGLAGGFWPR